MLCEEDIYCKVFAIFIGFRSVKSFETTTEMILLIDLDDEFVMCDELCMICFDVLLGEVVCVLCCGVFFCEDCFASYVAFLAAKGCSMCCDVDVFLMFC